MDLGELTVSVGELVGDGAVRLRPAAPDLSFGEFEPARLHDTHPMYRPGDRVQDRLPTHFQQAVDMRAGGTGVDIELELDLRE